MQLNNLSKMTKESITSLKSAFPFNRNTIFIDINESRRISEEGVT
jgi:hypothetical protein